MSWREEVGFPERRGWGREIRREKAGWVVGLGGTKGCEGLVGRMKSRLILKAMSTGVPTVEILIAL